MKYVSMMLKKDNMFDSQRYKALDEALTICEHQLPWELSEGRTKLIAVLTYLRVQLCQMESDFYAQLD